MTEYYARKEYVYSGGDAIFSIPFSYIDKEYIKVYINNVIYTGFTYLNDTQIRVNKTLKVGDVVVVVRETPIDDKFVTFTDTSILSSKQQNLAQDQIFNAMQETADSNAKFMLDAEAQAEKIAEEFQEQIDTFKEDINTEVSALDVRVTANTNNIQKHVEDVDKALHTATDSIDSKLAQAQTAANTATTKATAAATSASNAKTSETNAKTSETNANTYKNNAQTYMNNAKTYQDNAKSYMDTAETYRDNAETFKNNAATSAGNAGSYATVAREQALLAKKYAEQEHGQSDVTHSDLVTLEKNIQFPKFAIKDDTSIYAELESMKHSTFDRSKFTVVGTPTITDDGIVSGFSDSKYITFPADTFRPQDKSWKIQCKVKMGSVIDNATLVCINFITGVNYGALIKVGDTGIFNFQVFDENGTSIWSPSPKSTYIAQVNTEYMLELEFTGTQYIYRIKDIQEHILEQGSYDSTTVINQSNTTANRLGARAGVSQPLINGSIDLKQFSITVDGVEVFNGNKTGIDQIKKDDYTKQGDVVVSEGGIASGFSGDYSNTYIKTPNNIDTTNANTMRIEYGFTITKAFTTGQLFLLNYGSTAINGGGIQLYGTVSAIQSTINSIASRYTNWAVGDYFKVIFNYKTDENSTYILYKNGVQVIESSSLVTNWKKDTPIFFYGKYSGDAEVSVDLNAIKVYVDGNLVYQPTLHIPYTQSKTGEKIVDAVYRDRVEDMYNDYGYTHYYTIGDELEKYNVDVVGTPTLVGGVASGFSTSNYIRINAFPNVTQNNYKIETEFIYNGSSLTQSILGVSTATTYSIILYGNNTNKLRINLSSNGTSWDIASSIVGQTVLETGKRYRVSFVRENGTSYKVILKDIQANIETTEIVINSSLNINSNSWLNIGWTTTYTGYTTFKGSIDLSQFSITENGKEVFRGYEPTIPNAYTLATHKNNDIIDSGNNYEQTADLTMKQWGSCTSGSVVNLLPYKDTNYAVTAPYSAKTESSFTASATGDYIAVGKVVL